MSDWKLGRRQGLCTRCEQGFADGQRHVSTLSITGEDLRREDVCLACFAARTDAQDLFWWSTRHHAGKRGPSLDLAMLETLFVALEGRVEPRLREVRYLLCLLLMRKRRVKIDRILRGAAGEGESMVVHRPRRKESLRVWVFEFSAERMAQLRGELLSLFEGAEPSTLGGTDAPGEGSTGGIEGEGDAHGEAPEASAARVAAAVG